MSKAQTAINMSPGLAKVMERATRDPQARFNSLAHLIDVDLLRREFEALRGNAAVGGDGITKERYAQDLEVSLPDLHARLKAGRYRHQPIRRVHIPKGDGRTRPIGISTTEDKIVQGAVRTVLDAIYEPVFDADSYGFRRGRSAHDALRALHATLSRGRTSYILEADIQSFFDSLGRARLLEMLRARIADESLLRLVGKCLHVGVLDGEDYSTPEDGTAQGSVLSPLLGNIYLHHVLDLWFERDVRPRLHGAARLIRYADDFVIAFEDPDDARRVFEVLPKRMAKYGLALHPDKTRLLPMQRPSRTQGDGKGPATFDFLGFTVHWRRDRAGRWRVGMRTRRGRVHRALERAQEFCRGHRQDPLKVQAEGLARRLRGHLNYFGIQGNRRCLSMVASAVERIWWKWLNRRSQRSRMTWERFRALLRALGFPRPRILVPMWAPVP